jgi:hypothetical protein
MKKTKSQSKKNTALWKKVSKAMQDYYRQQHLHCVGSSKSCTRTAQVMHHWLHWGSCVDLRLDVRNLVPLCNRCHLSVHTGHQETTYNIRKAMERGFGANWEDQLMEARREAIHKTPKEWEGYLLSALELYN